MITIPENICCPRCGSTLLSVQQRNEIQKLSCEKCKCDFHNNGGIIEFITDDEVLKFNKRVEFMRAINAKFYTPLTNMMFIPCGGVKNARKEVLDQLEMKAGDKVLETGIGPGDNIIYLNGVMDKVEYYGLDNQMCMIRSCESNLSKWNQHAYLCRANAEALPFKNEAFDVVFHLGAINLFENKKQAIEEMIRVAKPGSKIVIADESEKASKLFAIFIGKQDPVVPPIDLVPDTMLEIHLETIWKGYGYLITFRKPALIRKEKPFENRKKKQMKIRRQEVYV